MAVFFFGVAVLGAAFLAGLAGLLVLADLAVFGFAVLLAPLAFFEPKIASQPSP